MVCAEVVALSVANSTTFALTVPSREVNSEIVSPEIEAEVKATAPVNSTRSVASLIAVLVPEPSWTPFGVVVNPTVSIVTGKQN